MNRVLLMGRLTKDLELRFAKGTGLGITRGSLAVDGFGKDSPTNFINIIAFGKRAETMAQYLTKGSKIAIEGHIQTGSYEKEDGSKVYTTDVVVDNFYFCDSKKTSVLEEMVELGVMTQKQINTLTTKLSKARDEKKGFDGTPVDDGDMPF